MTSNRRRERLRALAEDTVAILQVGQYRYDNASIVDISSDLAAAVAGSRMYPPDEVVHLTGPADPVIEVTGETTLAAARRLGGDVAALVFGSARNPGGGFLSGAAAQEESIARASALFACQQRVPAFYEYHRASRDLRYSDRVIYSPGVPVFRDDAGDLLATPYRATFLTAAAPNLGAIHTNQPELAASVPETVRRRAMRVVQVAAARGHRRLVLGAWGCGVFRNEPSVVAQAFAHALKQTGGFERIVFAVYDPIENNPTLEAFRAEFQA
jgi:uncharacterized protein (TIGR02452 family)